MDKGANQKWMELLRDYMINNHINHTFWCLNPNSGDTGGLLDSTFMNWDADKYGLFEKSLWQTSGGKFIGLDHQVALGKEGMSLSQFYSSGEKSNINGGTGSDKGNPKNDSPASPDTTKTTTTTTSTTTTSSTSKKEEATTTTSDSPAVIGIKLYGDANCDKEVTLADAVLIMQSLANPSKYGLEGTDKNKITAQGRANADVAGNGDGLTNADALAIQKYKLGLIPSLPETK